MQKLLAQAVQHTLSREINSVIIDFSFIVMFQATGDQLAQLQSSKSLILCQLETIFPVAFFDIMMHLLAILTEKARLAVLYNTVGCNIFRVLTKIMLI